MTCLGTSNPDSVQIRSMVGDNPLTIHEIYAALTPSDYRSDVGSRAWASESATAKTGRGLYNLKLKYMFPFIQCQCFDKRNRGSITSGWKEEESCTSELFCVLGRGLPSPKTQNNSRVQDSSSFHPRVIEPLSPTIKRRNLHVLPWS